MGLDLEYFTNQIHLKDLEKLKDRDLYFIIRLFQDELIYFNNYDGFQLNGLIKACNAMKDLIKDFRFILNGYMKLMSEKNHLPLFSLSGIRHLLSIMDDIENYLNKIKAVRLLKEKVNDLGDTCLLKIRMLYESLNDFICEEEKIWDTHSLLKEY